MGLMVKPLYEFGPRVDRGGMVGSSLASEREERKTEEEEVFSHGQLRCTCVVRLGG